MTRKVRCEYEIHQITNEYIYLEDCDNGGRSVTHDARALIEHLAEHIDLAHRRVFYLATDGRIDELWHEDGKFKGYAPQDQHAIKKKLGI